MIVSIKHIKKQNIQLTNSLAGPCLSPVIGQSSDELSLFLKNAVDFSVELSSSGKGLLVQGNLSTVLAPVCARCLEEFQFPLAVSFSVNLFPSTKKGLDKSDEVDILNANVDLYSGREIDLKPILWEQIALNSPNRFICREECLGLCQICGNNLNEKLCQCETDETRGSIFSRLLSGQKGVPSLTESRKQQKH